MKIKLILVLVLVTFIALCSARPAEEEYADYEEAAEPAPPPKKVPARTPLVGRRNPLVGRNNKAGASSTTTTTAAPTEEEVEESDYVEEQPAETSSTTEAPKKIIKTGVRPFRSNDDLLATLKRRREQVANNKHSKPVQSDPEEPAASAPVENETKSSKSRPSAGRKNRFGKENKSSEPAAAAEETSSTAAPARTGRRFHGRS